MASIALEKELGLNLGEPKHQTVSDIIRILAEVEKIWIRHDLNDDGELEYEEVEEYLNITAFPKSTLTKQ